MGNHAGKRELTAEKASKVGPGRGRPSCPVALGHPKIKWSFDKNDS